MAEPGSTVTVKERATMLCTATEAAHEKRRNFGGSEVNTVVWRSG